MQLNSVKSQYSFRLALPLNTAYFFKTAKYQLTAFPRLDLYQGVRTNRWRS